MGKENYIKITDATQGPTGARIQSTTRGIARPGAKRLTLPLVERHAAIYNYDFSSEENLVTLASSHWTISAVPRSTASLYSQDSLSIASPPPPVFSEENVDRRRFCIAMTPAQEGPWSRRQQRQESTVYDEEGMISMIATADSVGENPFSPSSNDEVVQKDTKEQAEAVEGFNDADIKFQLASEKKPTKERPPTLEKTSPVSVVAEEQSVALKESTITHFGLKRKSSTSSSKGIIGKMFSRRSSSSNSRQVGCSDEERQPLLLPRSPPQIFLPLPSPSLNIPSPTKAELIAVTEEDLRTFVLGKQATGRLPPRTRTTLPSKWKPARPPSPIPAAALGKRRKHKRNTTSLPYVHIVDNSASASTVVVPSPPPPLPSGARLALAAARDPKQNLKPESPIIRRSFQSPISSVATPVYSASDLTSPDSDRDVSRWADVRKRLKARALKSAVYAVHDGGMISPSGF